jgi:DNA polymerase III sliding clamp (beta) subunit (PCNA family)
MLEELKFVAGAVAKKDSIPYMTHFAIKNETVTSYNGVIALCSPIAFDIDCKPKADLLIKAIGNCKGTISLSITEAGRLKVQSGKFKAFIECLNEETPNIEPEGELLDIDGNLLIKSLGKLYKFISENPNHPWANGVLLANGSAFATNNVCIIEHWLGFALKTPINIPKAAIREIIRIKQHPERIQVCDRSITFHYPNKQWIKSQLLETKWPDIAKILNVESDPKPIDNTIFDGLEVLKPFTDKLGSIHFSEGLITTSTDMTTGSLYEVPSLTVDALYNIEMLGLLKDTAITIDWTKSPALFFGDSLRGGIIGMRK